MKRQTKPIPDGKACVLCAKRWKQTPDGLCRTCELADRRIDKAVCRLEPENRELLDRLKQACGFASDEEALRQGLYKLGVFVLGKEMPVTGFAVKYENRMRPFVQMELEAKRSGAA